MTRHRHHRSHQKQSPPLASIKEETSTPVRDEEVKSSIIEGQKREQKTPPLVPRFPPNTYGIFDLFRATRIDELRATVELDFTYKRITGNVVSLVEELHSEEKFLSDQCELLTNPLQEDSSSFFASSIWKHQSAPKPWPKPKQPDLPERKHSYQTDAEAECPLPSIVSFGPYSIWGVHQGTFLKDCVLPDHKQPIYLQPGYLFHQICN